MSASRLAWAVALLAVLGCGRDATGPAASLKPRGFSSDSPVFVMASSTAPAIANPVISFTAVKGQSYTVQMVYASQSGGKTPVFLTFKLDAQSLAFLPDGSPIQNGQAVPITLTLVDAVHMIVQFEPSGLRFDADHPAELKMSYAETDPDRNGDGVVNSQDTSATAQLRIWRQESSTDPWVKIATTPLLDDDEVDTELFGFTSYGIAY